MQIDPNSPTGLAFIADHIGMAHTPDDLADFIGDNLHRCQECDGLFTEAKDTGYGENHDRVCIDCCIEDNEDRFFARLGR